MPKTELTIEQREKIHHLATEEGKTMKETAQIMGLPITTIIRSWSNARKSKAAAEARNYPCTVEGITQMLYDYAAGNYDCNLAQITAAKALLEVVKKDDDNMDDLSLDERIDMIKEVLTADDYVAVLARLTMDEVKTIYKAAAKILTKEEKTDGGKIQTEEKESVQTN